MALDYDETTLVEVRPGRDDRQVRVTFTSSEVGNGNPNDSNTQANQDGGLAVRVQAENAAGELTGETSRYKDEAITFVTRGETKFEVRDLVSGVSRGDFFDVVMLGSLAAENINHSGEAESYYVNGGQGNDRITGGEIADFLVGGMGNDLLNGGDGNDSFIGGAGNDRIQGGFGDDRANFNVTTDGRDTVNLGTGADVVNVSSSDDTREFRLTFTSSEVGNGIGLESGNMANQDGGFAVRLQAEGQFGALGQTSRFDDEGMTFVSTTPGVTFDVRDLVSGTARGDNFQVVKLGTKSGDVMTADARDTYLNGGQGSDRITGSSGRDFLVGGAGNDVLNGGSGVDSFIGGTGADRFVFSGTPSSDKILDFDSGSDHIDLRAFGIDSGDVEIVTSGDSTRVEVDSNSNGVVNFVITVTGEAPTQADIIYG